MGSHRARALLLAASSAAIFVTGIQGCSSGGGTSTGAPPDASTSDGPTRTPETDASAEGGSADASLDSSSLDASSLTEAGAVDASEASVADSAAGTDADTDAGPPCAIALDPTFGTQGLVHGVTTQDVVPNVRSMLVQPDGKIVVTGTRHPLAQAIPITRLGADGTLDPSFGTGGIATLTATSSARALALQADGKILVSGVSVSTWFLGRVDASGATDTTFGTNGYAAAPTTGEIAAQAIAVRPNGAILVASVVESTVSGAWFQIAQFDTTGALDTTFGTSGATTTTVPGYTGAEPLAILLQPDGSAILGGYGSFTGDAGYTENVMLARFTPSGQLDTTFGTGGVAASTIGAPYVAVQGLALQSNGAIVAALSGQAALAAVRFTASGQLDTSFGSSGLTKVPLLGSLDAALAVFVLAGDSVLLAGKAQQPLDGGGYDTAIGLARLTPNGGLDTSFGTGGKVLTPCPGQDGCTVSSAALGPNDTLVVTASAQTALADGGTQYDLDFARYTCP